MNEETEHQLDLIPPEENIEPEPPFEIGDLVQMRAKDLKIGRFRKMPANDYGVVISLKPPRHLRSDWLVEVYWQKFIPKTKSQVKHRRLKKVRVKKGKNKQHATQKD
jgi:hypothetical protein